MYDTHVHIPTAKELAATLNRQKNLLLAGLGVSLVVIFGMMIAMVYLFKRLDPAAIVAVGVVIFTLVAVPILIWNNPRAGLLILFAATTVLDMDPRSLNTHRITTYVYFFLNINNVAQQYYVPGFDALKFSLAEAIIVITLFAWLIRSISLRQWRFESGPFLICMLFYAASTMFAFGNGYVSGGDGTMGLWEVRAQFYPLIMYILTMNLVTTKEQIKRILWMAFIGLGVLAISGIVSYLQLNGVVTEQGILDHEDSLILNIAIFLLLFTYLGGGNKKMVLTGLLFLPATLFTMLENQRRAGIASFVVAFLAALPVMYVLFVERRKLLARFILAFVLVGSVYVAAGWNASGAWALPARAIRSNFSPSERDAGSDLYRKEEDFDLKATRDVSPLIGYGYGRPFLQPYVLPAVTTGFLAYFAHDSVLWVWMRTGHIGFFIFLFFIATVFIKGMHICRETTDPDLRTVGMIAVFFLLMAYVYGKYDLQLTNFRTMMMLGIWLGLLGKLSQFAKIDAQVQQAEEPVVDVLDVETPAFLEGDTL